MNDIKDLLFKAVQAGETFYQNGLNETYLTRDMFQQFLELHKITDKEFDDAMKELIDVGLVYIQDDTYYRVSELI